jgi:hypothetical protein
MWWPETTDTLDEIAVQTHQRIDAAIAAGDLVEDEGQGGRKSPGEVCRGCDDAD